MCVSDSSSDFSSDSTDSDDAKKKHPKDLKSIQETNRLVFLLCCTHVCGILHGKASVCYRHQNELLFVCGCHILLLFVLKLDETS